MVKYGNHSLNEGGKYCCHVGSCNRSSLYASRLPRIATAFRNSSRQSCTARQPRGAAKAQLSNSRCGSTEMGLSVPLAWKCVAQSGPEGLTSLRLCNSKSKSKPMSAPSGAALGSHVSKGAAMATVASSHSPPRAASISKRSRSEIWEKPRASQPRGSNVVSINCAMLSRESSCTFQPGAMCLHVAIACGTMSGIGPSQNV
mmetsp:Transcript_59767/g.182584  ORF Transcript_59767/g.182584 Transcript_59767/m.182584 type:complete len:201 (+) Transcript_59767:538-1140(+)